MSKVNIDVLMTTINEQAKAISELNNEKQELIEEFLQGIDRIEDASIRQTVNNNLEILGDTIQEERKKWEKIKDE